MPDRTDAIKHRANLCEDLSTFGVVNIRTILFDTLTLLNALVSDYANVGETQFWKNPTVYISSSGEPYSISDVIQNLQGIKNYVKSPEAKQDINTAQELLSYSNTNI